MQEIEHYISPFMDEDCFKDVASKTGLSVDKIRWEWWLSRVVWEEVTQLTGALSAGAICIHGLAQEISLISTASDMCRDNGELCDLDDTRALLGHFAEELRVMVVDDSGGDVELH